MHLRSTWNDAPWEAYVDPNSGRQYYVHGGNHRTTTWDAPPGLEVPHGWTALFDPHRQRNYFVHKESGKTTWQRPKLGSAPPQPQPSSTTLTDQKVLERRVREQAVAGAPRRETDRALRRTCDAIGATVVVDRIRDLIVERNGSLGIQRLARAFVLGDRSGDGRLGPREFRDALAALRVHVGDEDLDHLFSYFDRDRDGTLDSREFVGGLRGRLGESQPRVALVREAFARIQSRPGVLSAADLRLSLNPAFLPDAMTGRATASSSSAACLPRQSRGGARASVSH